MTPDQVMDHVSKYLSLVSVASWLSFFASIIAHHKVTTSYYIDVDINFTDCSLQEKFRHFWGSKICIESKFVCANARTATTLFKFGNHSIVAKSL
jgi:hypothetical protein